MHINKTESLHKRILILSEDDLDREHIYNLLKKSSLSDFDIIKSTSTIEVMDVLVSKGVDCLLIDYAISNASSLEFIQRLKSLLNDQLPVIIVLADESDDEAAVASVRIGASDFLNKNHLNLLRLETSIVNNIQQHQINLYMRKEDDELKSFALLDALTGLANRRSFDRELPKFIAAARRYDRLSALLFIDLDGFKKVNDTLGHDYGDLLLKQVTVRLNLRLRQSDFLARLGGDEFALILNEITDEFSASVVANKLCQVLAEPFFINDEVANIGASIGVAIFPTATDNPSDIVKQADRAMYHVKKSGKNGYFLYQEGGRA